MIINELADKHNTPRFVPHVTVTGPIEGKSGEEVLKICTELAATLPVRPAPTLGQLSCRASSNSGALPTRASKALFWCCAACSAREMLKPDFQARCLSRYASRQSCFPAQHSVPRLLRFACIRCRLLP